MSTRVSGKRKAETAAPAPAPAPAPAVSSSAAASSSSQPTYEVRGLDWLNARVTTIKTAGGYFASSATKVLTMVVLDENEAFHQEHQQLKWNLSIANLYAKRDVGNVNRVINSKGDARIAVSFRDFRAMLGLSGSGPSEFTERWFRAMLRTFGTPHLLIMCAEHAAWVQSAISEENKKLLSLAQDPLLGGVTIHWTTKGKSGPPPAPAGPPPPPPRPKPHDWGTNLLKVPTVRLAYAPYHPFEEWELQLFRNRNRMRDFMPNSPSFPLRGIKAIDFERRVVDKIITTAKSQGTLKCKDASLVWKLNVIKEIDARYYNSGLSLHHYPWSEKSDWEAVADAAEKLNVDICTGIDGPAGGGLSIDRMEMHNLLAARKERAEAEAKRAEEMRAWDAKHAEVSEAAPALSYEEAFKKKDDAARAKAISLDDD